MISNILFRFINLNLMSDLFNYLRQNSQLPINNKNKEYFDDDVIK